MTPTYFQRFLDFIFVNMSREAAVADCVDDDGTIRFLRRLDIQLRS